MYTHIYYMYIRMVVLEYKSYGIVEPIWWLARTQYFEKASFNQRICNALELHSIYNTYTHIHNVIWNLDGIALLYFLDEWFVFAATIAILLHSLKPTSICILTWSWTFLLSLLFTLHIFFSNTNDEHIHSTRFLVIYQLNTFAILLLYFLRSLSISIENMYSVHTDMSK